MPTLNLQTTTFNLPLLPHEVPKWRGAFVEMAGRQTDRLHNHIDKDSYHYRYPLVQYRSQYGKASLFAINEGIEDFTEILTSRTLELNWKGKPFDLKVEATKRYQGELAITQKRHSYRLTNWVALNQGNFPRWKGSRRLSERAELLEGILVGQILGFCSAFDYQLPERLEVFLQEIHGWKEVYLRKGNPLLAFEVSYQANIDLPSGIALGKGVSLGLGVQEKKI